MIIAAGVSRTLKGTSILGLLALAAAGAAHAACGFDAPQHSVAPKLATPGLFTPAVFHPNVAPGLIKVSMDEYDPGIVGLWQFKMTGQGVPNDFGTQAWHGDGTEFMFSGGQNPETGDVCQGVWRQVARNKFTLNHIAMSWGMPGGPFGLRVHMHFVVSLNPSATAFTGTFTEKVYAVTEADPFDENSTPVAQGGGTITAERVIPD
ncbi:MAG TPA: hypothetical protein VMF03_12465 [Steroidobacteraceae bacterium]|nr:hypothetical protein [Steroidobacteraceae bacterium]